MKDAEPHYDKPIEFSCEDCPFLAWNDERLAILRETDPDNTSEIEKHIVMGMEALVECDSPEIKRIGFFGRHVLRCASPATQDRANKILEISLRKAIKNKRS